MNRWFSVWRRLRDLERLALMPVVTQDPKAEAAWRRIYNRVHELDGK